MVVNLPSPDPGRRMGIGVPISQAMAEKLITHSQNPYEELEQYMREIDVDADPGELVHITKGQLKELHDFNRQFAGIGALSRVYEEITYQQHAAARWAALYEVTKKQVSLWRALFIGVNVFTAAIQIIKFIAEKNSG